MKSLTAVFSRLMVLALTVSVLAGQTMFAFALTSGNLAGEITVTGRQEAGEKPFVLVNGDPAFSGRTFFSDGTITTTETSSASIDFGKIGRVNLGPNSTLTLSVSETSISGKLAAGSISVSNSDGVSVKIDTPDDTVTNEGVSASRFTVNVAADKSSVAAESGSIRYNNGATVATKQDDDDDDDGEIWVPIIVFGGAIGAVIFFTLTDDDDDVVSPVR
jgi:hypothetical protein